MSTYPEAAVAARLLAATAVTALVGDRIYPLELPQNAMLPAVTYQRISGERVRSINGPSGMGAPRIQVDCWSDGTLPTAYADAKAVARAVRQALDGYRGTVAGVRVGSVLLVGERDLDEPETQRYRDSLDFTVWHDED